MNRRNIAIILLAACGIFRALPVFSFDRQLYTIYIVVDVLKPKFQEVIDGFCVTMDKQLAANGAKAVYTVFDTKTDPATVPGILEAIRKGQPDLICAINGPAAFADRNISLKLSGPKYRIVSENCIPVQSKVAATWEKPGGNITGVGVFVQMTSVIKMAKMIEPKATKLIFFSWDKMTDLNAWFVAELIEACRKEGVELAEVRYVSSAEDEFAFLLECDKKGREYFVVGGISAWVHRDGSFADMTTIETEFLKRNIRHIPIYGYEDVVIKISLPAGVCVIWHDLGAQLADKGIKVLNGANPGDLPWEYPRKQQIVLNLAVAKQLGITFPQNLLSAAYRIYTDFEGNFLGQ